MTERPDVATLSYEEAREELVDVVARLEAGSTTLEDSLALWERGEALADRCQSWLDSAREKLASAQDTVTTAEGAVAETDEEDDA